VIDPNTYVEEEHWRFVTTLVHIRVELGACEGMWYIVKEGAHCMRTLG
jgi:hypothetical protein